MAAVAAAVAWGVGEEAEAADSTLDNATTSLNSQYLFRNPVLFV